MKARIAAVLLGSPATETVACAEPLGRPPNGSSLVQPKGGKSIELYVPKRCLLDRKVARSRTS